MRRLFLLGLLVVSLVFCSAAALAQQQYHDVKTADLYPEKQYVIDWVKQPRVFDKYASIGDAIWNYAELGMQEFNSSKLLADNLEAAGFKVERGMAGMPTCFVATYGSGKPVIGLLGEFDALPMLSQKAGSAVHDPVVEGAPGHGCGHNTMCTTASCAAEAVKNAIDKFGLKGTIKVFGSPSEETLISRPFMVKAGLFDGVDVVIDNHGGTGSTTGYAKGSGAAMFSAVFSFKGTTAHAGGAPWAARSALDAVEIMDVATNFLREHLMFSNRTHYVIPAGGEAPNVVPDFAQVWYFVRNSDALVESDYQRVVNCAKAAALATDTQMEERIYTAIHQTWSNENMAKALQANIQLIGMPAWTPEEQALAKAIQKAAGAKEVGMPTEVGKLRVYQPASVFTGGGSSDVAEVSLIAPLAALNWPNGAPGSISHHWTLVATGATSIAHKAMNIGGQVMASTIVDLLTKPEIIKAAKEEFAEQLKQTGPYKSYLPEGTKPPVDLNKELMEKYRPLMEPFYTKGDTTPIGPDIKK